MVKFSRSDLQFILDQILISEAHAAGADLLDLIPNPELPWGLRTINGSGNNLTPGLENYGVADQPFPRMVPATFTNENDETPFFGVSNTNYGVAGHVVDSDPRTISNLIVDQTPNNPAAVVANGGAPVVTSPGLDGVFGTADDKDVFLIPATAPDEGLSAPFNSWMTFFGQFFDHGLDLVTKSSTETVFIPLKSDDPLFNPTPGAPNFMVLSRAVQVNGPGADGIVGTADDTTHEAMNTTSPFVDQSQTYASHPSHQVFLREYTLNAAGDPVSTGKLLTNRTLGADGEFGGGDDVEIGGMATWGVLKAQARDMLGIDLTDADVGNLPLLATDQYGMFIRGANGYPQVVFPGNVLVEGNPAAPISLVGAVRTGHAFLDDIAHNAAPRNSAGVLLAEDADAVAGNTVASGEYDNELLDAHFVAGDGRVNENIGLTAVHHVFHSEHNRLVDHTIAEIVATGDAAFMAQWRLPDGSWNGERIFQAAKFGTEMQYQHLVFEEFARTIQPNIDAFLDYDATVNPSIVAEFAHTVYRFGHSMLTETIDRLSPEFQNSEMGLIEAFLNPLAFTQSDGGALTPDEAAGAIIRGTTRQVGNEIDEFVTEALRNNLLGLPLDLPALNVARGRDTGIPSLNAARREFFAGTGDSQLRPYTSWADYAQFLKHPESLINFIAAYGTHASITGATTLVDKRAAATAIVLGGGAVSDAERLAFLNSTGAWASGPNGVTITGLDTVDFWIGGLAEKIMPFGGMLGSTFNFVFETQMESLQDGDRLYYLHRVNGLNFLGELENNSFAKLIMANTDATHLPSLVFVTPGLILEVDQTKQFNADLGLADPAGEVVRDNPATPGADSNYLQYTGEEHVVLGGTTGDDILIASIGDDTLYGDEGNDRLEGGDGNDMIEGGAGHDIITDRGGDDVLKGDEGNDVIQGGQGINLIIAGRGKDFVITGEDESETFAGEGDDFILGSFINIQTAGNEGNDWIEYGTQDGAVGDNFDPLAMDLIQGHDIFIGGSGFDEMIGEGGDDIMVGSDGPGKMLGHSGFDWATFKDEALGVTADFYGDALNAAPIPASTAAVSTRFADMEGLSGSAHGDVLRGDDETALTLPNAGAQGSVLTHIDLVAGLRQVIETALGGPQTSFGAGNILLGGSGSDILEGRGGDDIVDGDKWLNVRISVRQNIDGTGPQIATFDSMRDLMPLMLAGTYNPGQLVAIREVLTGAAGYDTAVFSDIRANYTVTTTAGVTTVVHNNAGLDGTDRLTNVERLQFADQVQLLTATTNVGPSGLLAILDANSNAADGTPTVGQVLRASIAGVSDGNNPGAITGPVAYYWQVEAVPGSGIYQDIGTLARAAPTEVLPTLTVTADLAGLSLRVRAVYTDETGVQENVFSNGTAAVAAGAPAPAPAPLPAESEVLSDGLHLIRADMQFILDQIKISEAHAAGESLLNLLPNARVPYGLRTVDGSFNNLLNGQSEFGASDNVFPRLLDPVFSDAENFDPDGPGGAPAVPTSYNQTSGVVSDSQPRTISNLISDQTATNPVAVEVNAGAAPVISPGLDGIFGTADDKEVFFIPATAPDEGLSASFNSWMTFFGQFFDHGLDLVTKGGSGTVFIPLQPDDPLFNPAPGAPNFMVLTRATNQPGPDGNLGTIDDIHEHTNTTSPFVDQSQTYASHASHQVFLREYALNATGKPVATGELLTNRTLGLDGKFGGGDDVDLGGMATWGVLKAQARDILGIDLTDANVGNVPLLATDQYGMFLRGSNGYPQVVFPGNVLLEGNPAAPISLAGAVGTGHAFLDDIAHSASPAGKTPDADTTAGGTVVTGEYDNELLDAHYVAGDGRVNENIGLTAVHHVFHSEHNRLVEHNKDVALASNDINFLREWLMPGTAPADMPTNQAQIDALVWNGERLFQSAKFGTEMQYQHLVFEEFARTIQPNIDVFIAPTQNYQPLIDPSVLAEFAHTVYRFGHSMLTETVDRFDANFNPVTTDPLRPLATDQMGLIAAFLNPLAFAASGPDADAAAGAIVRGTTRQVGNEIDEFVTEALRNNLVGLPLDLPALNIARGRDTGIPSFNAARREFYAMTGDSQLKPYISWNDFAGNIKHAASAINFIAAYGTHATVLAATTLEAKRQAAIDLVFGVVDESAATTADRLAFLNGTGAYAADLGGLEKVDFWIGGLAERIMPFGGMLGSTFNFVFETQMEALQNGDRFYYLDRTAGLNFVTELENNSFAKMIMNATDATHLPGVVFLTPGLILEVDQTRQFNDGLGSADPIDGTVSRDDASTAGVDTNYVQYSGDEHVVLGGTNNNDTLISSLGDDTIYGDDGNDVIEGGDGNDMIEAGRGHDIVTDVGGDDVIKGEDGNDVIHGGNGINLIMGGFGKDFIVTGEDASEAFGGTGDDFILGANNNEQDMGNEGDDWLEGGLLDGAPGDNFDHFGLDLIVGNDIYIGSGLTDIMNAEGGDDIMVGSGGPGDKYLGASGFDWATYRDDAFGVNVDLGLRAFNLTPLPASATAILARFEQVEGLSGSAHSDVLRGDENDAAAIAVAGAQGSVMTNIGLIGGMQDFLGAGVTSFGTGNIILGGAGNDLIEGLGGDDLIDGDKWLNVRISVRANADGTGQEIASFNTMAEMVALMVNGMYNPGQLVAVRELLEDPDPGFDTAVFRGNLLDYTININDNGTALDFSDDVVTVTDGVAGRDGVDRMTNIERLQFADQAVVVVPGLNAEPEGLLRLSDGSPAVGQTITVSAPRVLDADNGPTGAFSGPVSYFWQVDQGTGFADITVFAGGELARVQGPSFAVPADLVGFPLRVKAIFRDGQGVLETVYSAPTTAVAAVGNPNDLPTGTVLVSDTTPTVGQIINAAQAFTDADGLVAVPVNYQWQTSTDGLIWIDLAGESSSALLVVDAYVGLQLRALATFTDNGNTTEYVYSAGTTPVVAFNTINGTSDPETLAGTALRDLIFGLAGNDSLSGLASNDTLNGGSGNDTLDGGTGNDSMLGGADNDLYIVDSTLDVITENLTEGTDSVQSSATYTLSANVENLTLTGAAAINGTGNASNNLMVGNGAGNTLTGGDGNDTNNGGNGNDVLNGGTGDDNLNGEVGNDTLNGGAGSDTLNGGTGNDSMAGGTDNDMYLVDSTADVVTEAGGQGTDLVQSSVTWTLSANVEHLTLTGGGNLDGGGNILNNLITGNTGNNVLAGGAGNDTLLGVTGNDTLNGGIGVDSMAGGIGDDTYLVADVGDVVTEAAVAGTDTVRSSLASYVLTAGVENLILTAGGGAAGDGNALANVMTGGTGNDTLRGFGANDTIIGGNGNDSMDGGANDDSLTGGAGNDTLLGGTGADTMAGGTQDDVYVVDNTADVVVEAGGQGVDTVSSSATFTLSANVENLTLTGVANTNATGNVLDNVLSGNAGNNLISGGLGADSILGQNGNDTLDGGTQNDTLNGGAGTDRIIGGNGNDSLTGGTGNDVFVFGPGYGNDVITDFDALLPGGQDLLDISALGVTVANFAAQVAIADVGADALISIGSGTIRLTGIGDATTVTIADFLLA
jgi:Ca2+-binding RTX toxin-like protein